MLHVLVGKDCNNNCLFCMEADRAGRAKHIGAQSGDDVRRMIFAYPRTDEILFTSGEPTLCPDLPTYPTWAKERGFEVIGVITNGRRLAYESFAQRLVDCGMNRVTISIHGHTSKLHDGLTRSPGSFHQTRAGLTNCAKRKRDGSLRLHTSTVLTRRNLPHLHAIHAMLRTFDVDEMVFNVMMAKGRGARHFESLMPRYGAVVAAFESLWKGLDANEVRRLRVVDMPLCILHQLPGGIGGDLEEFDQYEPTGSTGVSGLEVLSDASTPERRVEANQLQGRAAHVTQRLSKGGLPGLVERGRAKAARALSKLHPPRVTLQAFTKHGVDDQTTNTDASIRRKVSTQELQESRPYYVTGRAFKDQFLRVKGPPCERCNARNRCNGVWEVYVDAFGWDELVPLDDGTSD